MDIRVRCSRGTYIRSLAAEIGEELGSEAYLTALRRRAAALQGRGSDGSRLFLKVVTM